MNEMTCFRLHSWHLYTVGPHAWLGGGTCVTAHWGRVIVFYIYRETHRVMEGRICGWKSSAY